MTQTILYVDDEPWFVEPLIQALQDAGYEVDFVSRAKDAIDLLKSDRAKPDLVVLDVIMPIDEDVQETNGGRRTGLKLHAIIRRELGLKMPILFLTVVDDPNLEREVEKVDRSVGIKSAGVLVKPVLPTELLEKTASLFKDELVGKYEAKS